MDPRPYLRVVWRWRWLVVLIVVTCALTSVLVSYQLPKAYATTATGLVSPKQLLPGGTPDATQAPNIDQLVETYVGLINTDPVRSRLVKDGIPRSTDQLKGAITAARAPSSTLIKITIVDSEPGVAQAIARDIIPAFNASLDDLQTKVGVDSKSRLDALVLWEVPATAPTTPITPNIPRNVELAVAASLVGAILLAFLIERLDSTVKTEADLREKTGLTVLGSVIERPAGDLDPDQGIETVVVTHPTDPLAEQYRAIRTNVLFSRVDSELRTLIVTSPSPGEGKTTTASNLAVVLAQAGNNVILVDADFRRPAIHSVFGVNSDVGLGNLILGDKTEDEVLQSTKVPRLRVVCTGVTPANPSELLGSSSMQRALERLNAKADVVILDTPPVTAVTDATVLSALVDGVVVVVERGGTSFASLTRSIETMQGVGARIIGLVLNKARAEAGVGYYYYYGPHPSGRKGQRRKTPKPEAQG
ncbi:MAG: tyrosine-protein kinase [Chloroflexota bacterium]|jgi:capsular exopolysaccharide synthesis family protein|nr:tyrosine-protein kinase [Chloroflexota bacterium]